MTFKPIDPKRDEFRRYLEGAGVIESLTKVFVRLVKERPENPMEYLRLNLGDSRQQADNYNYLQTELAEARKEISRLKKIIQEHPEALKELQTESLQKTKAIGKNPFEDVPLNESGSSDLDEENQTTENKLKDDNKIANKDSNDEKTLDASIKNSDISDVKDAIVATETVTTTPNATPSNNSNNTSQINDNNHS